MDLSVVVASRPEPSPGTRSAHGRSSADRLGYGEVWIGEGWVWDCFALATAIGLATERIALTIGPVPVSLRDPAMIAVGVASAAALTRRTVGVALGASSTRFVDEGCTAGRGAGPGTALAESAQAVRAPAPQGYEADLDGRGALGAGLPPDGWTRPAGR